MKHLKFTLNRPAVEAFFPDAQYVSLSFHEVTGNVTILATEIPHENSVALQARYRGGAHFYWPEETSPDVVTFLNRGPGPYFNFLKEGEDTYVVHHSKPTAPPRFHPHARWWGEVVLGDEIDEAFATDQSDELALAETESRDIPQFAEAALTETTLGEIENCYALMDNPPSPEIGLLATRRVLEFERLTLKKITEATGVSQTPRLPLSIRDFAPRQRTITIVERARRPLLSNRTGV